MYGYWAPEKRMMIVCVALSLDYLLQIRTRTAALPEQVWKMEMKMEIYV